MPNKTVLNVFIGFQFRSDFYKPSDFRAMGNALALHLQRKGRPVELSIECGEFPAGTRLWDELQSGINAAHVTIFDISENNLNVSIEVGIALGAGKHVILLKSGKSSVKVAADIQDFICESYSSARDLCRERFLERIALSIERFLKDMHDPFFYSRLLWSLMPGAKTTIVPGILPEKYRGNRFEDYIHFRRFSDLDAVFSVLRTLHRLYPRMDLEIRPASKINDLPTDWERSNLIFIGGPDFNQVVDAFDQLNPIEYKHRGNQIWLRHKSTGEEFRPEFYTKNRTKWARDFGFFLARRRGRARIVFIGGARTWGVYGAAHAVSCDGFDKQAPSYANTRKLVEMFGSSPSLLVPVEISGSREGIDSPLVDFRRVTQLKD